ncbi:MAG: Hpt domain-containing protein, partial [Oligoflexales bacterium]|nr:Hpt domain-containing protein [Oligoflexales bacterium]
LVSSKEFIEENSAILKGTTVGNQDILATLCRNLHTVKGNARILGLRSIVEAVHKAEQTYDELHLMVKFEWNSAQLMNELSAVGNLVGKYEWIYKTKLAKRSGNIGGDEIIIKRNTFDEVYNSIKKIKSGSSNEEARETLNQIRTIFEAVDSVLFEEAISGILKAMPILARELNKEPPSIRINELSLKITREESELIKNILMHSFRNSIDHGIETKEKRRNSGKHPVGSIDLYLEILDGNLKIVQTDDGTGLNISQIRRKALEKGLISENDSPTIQEIAEFIFIPGITTAEKITQISGRGLGMDAIKAFVEAKGGMAEIVLQSEVTVRGFAPFSLVLTIPRNKQAQALAA